MQFYKGIAAQFANQAVGDAVVNDAHQPLQKRRDQCAKPNHDRKADHSGDIDVVLFDDQIDGVSCEQGNIQRQCHGSRGKQKREMQRDAVVLQIVQNAL